MFSLEAEYRAYRRAAERYHAKAEQGFQLVLSLVPDGRNTPDEAVSTEKGPVQAVQVTQVALTTRETQMLTLIAAGNSTKQAAFILGIRFKTAAGHRSQLMKKLDIHDTASLVRFAIRAGLLEP